MSSKHVKFTNRMDPNEHRLHQYQGSKPDAH